MRARSVSHFILAVFLVVTAACRPESAEPVANNNGPSDIQHKEPVATSSPIEANSSLVEIAAQNVFQRGEDSVDRVDVKEIPNAPAISRIYSASSDNFHYKTTAVIDTATAVFKVKAETEEAFKRIRILRLFIDDIHPSGYGWRDCTVEPKDRPKVANPATASDYVKRFDSFLPNFEKKTVSCEFEMGGYRDGQYFVVVSQTAPFPTGAFTKIKAESGGVEKIPNTDESIYILSVKNLGPKDAAEVNFRSDFDYDTDVLAIETTNGRCQGARNGSTHQSVVCYLGGLPVGTEATIRFRSRPAPAARGTSGKTKPSIANSNWRVVGFSKETEADDIWSANIFKFGKQLLTKRKS